MKIALLMLAVGGAAFGQSAVQRGEALFARTCGTGYCHGAAGVGGGAPRLAVRGLEFDYIRSTVTNGVPGTAMAAYGPTMPAADLAAVVAYVSSLNGAAQAMSKKPVRPLSPEAKRGQVLFSEATRGFGRCSTCHSVGGIGIAIAPPIVRVASNASTFMALATPGVSTVTVNGEVMSALIVARRAKSVEFYDLSIVPPVLRIATPAEMTFAQGATWRHSGAALGTYTMNELSAILAYLRAFGDKPR